MILLGLVFGAIAILAALVFLFKYLIDSSSSKILASGASHSGLLKKYEDVDIHKFVGLFTTIGLVFSLAVVLMAFEWKTYDDQQIVSLGKLEDKGEEVIEIPPTEQKPPPPPKITLPEIVEVPDDEVIDDKVEVDLNVEVNQSTVIQKQVVVKVAEVVKEEEVDEIFTIVEEGAVPVGGYEEFYKYIKKTLKYPSQARRMGVEGKVYVQFVVDKDGSLNEIKVIKGIGAGCDEEAARVIQGAAKWKAGKQRGRPVKQRIVMPISFKLG